MHGGGTRRARYDRRVPRLANDPLAVRAYLDRDWSGAREGERAYWRARIDQGGLAEALLVTQQLYDWMKHADPAWPTREQRDEDLETHVRVAEALQKTAGRDPSVRTGTSRRSTPRVR